MEKLGVTLPLLVSQIVNFAILAFLLNRFLYQPILGTLAKRREQIAQSLKDAERVNSAAQEAEQDKGKVLEVARREAQEIRAAATRDVEKIAQEIRSRAESEATDIRMKAQAEAKQQTETALADANKQISDLAIAATEKLLGRELAQKNEQQRFVTEFLAQARGGSK